MSIAKIRAALESRLSALSPPIATAFENMAFSPVPGMPFQRVNLLPARPENEVLGSGYFREVGIFQVTLCFPMNGGPAACQARAELLRSHFKRGTKVTNGGITTIVTTTPALSAGYVDGDRYCIPLSIRYRAEIIT